MLYPCLGSSYRKMTYTNGTMTLPKNAVVMDQEEMRYVEGGASWSKSFKLGKYRYTVKISDLRSAAASFLYASVAICCTIVGILDLCGACASGNALGATIAAATIAIGLSAFGYSVSQLEKLITITKKKI